VAKVLRAGRPECKVVVSEPAGAALLQSGTATERNADGSAASTHPAWAPHPIQGWTPDFVSKITEDAQSMNLIDEVLSVEGDIAIATAHRLAREEGIFTGISGGATMATALEVAAKAPKGSTVLCMIPDTGERYLSTPLFADIGADMDEGEQAISQSTPSGHVASE
jgi:cysteine synthase A